MKIHGPATQALRLTQPVAAAPAVVFPPRFALPSDSQNHLVYAWGGSGGPLQARRPSVATASPAWRSSPSSPTGLSPFPAAGHTLSSQQPRPTGLSNSPHSADPLGPAGHPKLTSAAYFTPSGGVTSSGHLSFAPEDRPDGRKGDDRDPSEQRRVANLGATIELLKQLVPQMVSTSLPKSLVSPEVLLRVCPTHFDEFNAYLPAIKGHVPYYTSCKLLQFVLTSVVLAPTAQLHIQSVRTSVNDRVHPYYCVYPHSTKVLIRWTTSTETVHSSSDPASRTLKEGWSKVATTKFLNDELLKNPSPKHGGFSAALADLTTSIKSLAKDKKNDLERVISGIFIFELNEENDRIIVHTIEDIDILERTEAQEDINGLRVC